jgi:putative ABC transport system permease protein
VFKFALRGLASRKLRSILTGVAILLGAAMISGTYVLTDQVSGAFNDIFKKANEGTDVILTQKTEFTSQQSQPGPLPESLVPVVRRVPGVALAEGQIGALGSLVVDGKYVAPEGGAPPLVFSTPTRRFNTNQLLSGHFPSAHGEIAVDKSLADRKHLTVGQRVGLTTRIGVQPVRIAGIFRFADSQTIGGATLTATTFRDAQRWYDRVGQVSTILVAAQPGVTPGQVQRNIQRAVPSSVLVETGTQNAERQAGDVNDSLGFLKDFLFAFAIIALVVGAFIIFNTFSITVAQRTRELAMLRTIGATRRQLQRSVLLEAAVIGLIASLVGIAVGVLFAFGLNKLFDAFGFGLPTTGISIKARTVYVPVLVGVLVTLFAAYVPARRATRVPPVAALREGATLPPSRFQRWTPWIGVGLIVVGVLAIASGFSSSGGVTQRIGLIAIGGLLDLFGVGLLMRYAVRPLARVIGWPFEKVFGTSAKLGTENAIRNPSRTAATAGALMVGVGLVVFVTVFVQGLKSSFIDAIDRNISANLIIVGEGFNPLPSGAVQATRQANGVADVLGVGFAEVKIGNGGTDNLNSIDPNASRIVNFDWRKGGSDALIPQLGTDGAIVESNFASSHNLTPGKRFRITTVDGKQAVFRVLGEYRDPQLFTGFTVSTRAYDRLFVDRDVGVILAKFAPGVPTSVGKASVASALQQYPSAKVRTNTEYKNFISKQVNQILTLFYALLSFAVIIALFGVVITLVLSIYERTREIGMMRAIGTTRGQLRAIIRSESVVTCAIGGLIGIGVGLFFGWIVSRGLQDQGLSFTVPGLTLVVIFVLALIAGVLAAIFPARRAARLPPLEALHYE